MKTVLITGANGFVGSHVVKELKNNYNLLTPTRKELNLLNFDSCQDYFSNNKIDYVIHLAAVCGGIGANSKHPASFFFNNTAMSLHILKFCHQFQVEKLITLGSVCSYPKYTSVPFKEEDIWDGYPEETNAPYGIAKKTLMEGRKAFNQEFGSNFIHLVPVNMYGENDNFDESSSHVIPALFKKFIKAKKNGDLLVPIWGDGTASREFLHASDCARAIRLALENYDNPEPVNIGTGKEITIQNLALCIQDIVGYEGGITFDKSKPNGQPRRCLDVTKAKEKFGFEAEVELKEGLERVYKWIQEECNA